METEQGTLPDPAGAAAALREVEQARRTLDDTVPPWWYFVATAALVMVVPAAALIPSGPAGAVVGILGFAGWAGLFGALIAAYTRNVGFVQRLRRMKPHHLILPAVLSGAVMGVATFLADSYDRWWIGFFGSGLVAAGILTMGAAQRRIARNRRGGCLGAA